MNMRKKLLSLYSMKCATHQQHITLRRCHQLWKLYVNEMIFQNGGLGGMPGATILFQHLEDLICQGLIWLNLVTH